MNTDNNIKEFITRNYYPYIQFMAENFPIENSKLPCDFYEIFILKILPEIKCAKDKNEVHEKIKKQISIQYNETNLTNNKEIKEFSDKLYSFCYEQNRNPFSEKLFKVLKATGFLLMSINFIFIILAILFPRGGYSMGLGFLLLSVLLWLVPSYLGYLATRQVVKNHFDTKHRLLLIINILFIGLFTFLGFYFFS